MPWHRQCPAISEHHLARSYGGASRWASRIPP